MKKKLIATVMMISFTERPIMQKASTPNSCFRYPAACGVSFTKCKITGAETAISTVITAPHKNDSFAILMPYVFPRFKFPAPSSFPIMMPAALDIPALRQQMISRTTAATELAAAASVPMCPINVISDDEKGLYLSTKYMINHGHTEIAFVADYEGNIVLTKRFNGYKKALEDSHIPFRPEYIFSYSPSYEGGVEAGRAIASGKAPITAVVTTADICAIGIMEGARLGGYRVPIDLSVIGYDNLNLCQYTVPKLTSVSQNVPKKARLATELLLKKIHDNEADCNFGEIMDVEIVDRQSVISLY